MKKLQKITLKQAKYLGNIFNLNFNIINLKEWRIDLYTELEHGSKFGSIFTNVTNNNLIDTARIALAHLIEDPYYYKNLQKMEHKQKKYWKIHKKPNIFI